MGKQDQNDNLENNLQNGEGVLNSRKILNIVYLVIFISIAIGVFLYINQNKEIINTNNVENTDQSLIEQSIETLELNNYESNNTSIKNTTGTIKTDDDKKNEEDTGSIISTGTIKTDDDKKNEEAIIKDFEKELDSLFDVIDQNAK